MEEFLRKLLVDIVSKIMTYNSHPVADLVKELITDYEELDDLTQELWTFSECYFRSIYDDFHCDCCGDQLFLCECWCPVCDDMYKRCQRISHIDSSY